MRSALLVLAAVLLAGCAATPGFRLVDIVPAQVKAAADAGHVVVLPFLEGPLTVRLALEDASTTVCAVGDDGSTCERRASGVYEGFVVGDEAARAIALLDAQQVRVSIPRYAAYLEPCGELGKDGTRRHMAYDASGLTWPFC